MARGPLGGPRPFAQDTLDDEALFTSQLASGRLTIPEWFREVRGIGPGDKLDVTLYPLSQGVLELVRFKEIDNMEVSNRNRIVPSAEDIRDLRMVDGMGVLVVVRDQR